MKIYAFNYNLSFLTLFESSTVGVASF